MAVATFYFGGREVLSRSSQRCYRIRRTKHTHRLSETLEIVIKFRLMRSTTDIFTEVCCRRSFLRILATHEVKIVADSLPSTVRTDAAKLAFPILEVLDWTGFSVGYGTCRSDGRPQVELDNY
jgi:hypothetical protein